MRAASPAIAYPPPMGRRRNRKQERRQRHGGYTVVEHEPRELDPRTFVAGAFDPIRASDSEYDFFMMYEQRGRVAVKSCGGCTEFLEDAEGGRGTCLHPGSGVLSPWTDTKACDFFAARRRA